MQSAAAIQLCLYGFIHHLVNSHCSVLGSLGKVWDAPGNAAPTLQSPLHIPRPQNSSAPAMPSVTQLLEGGVGQVCLEMQVGTSSALISNSRNGRMKL